MGLLIFVHLVFINLHTENHVGILELRSLRVECQLTLLPDDSSSPMKESDIDPKSKMSS